MGNLIIKGGWLLVPIILCSIFSLAVIIERFLFFTFSIPSSHNIRRIVHQILEYVQRNKVKEAIRVCNNNSFYLTNIIKTGLLRDGQAKEVVREAMDNAYLYEIPKLEKNLNFLSTLAHISPLIGLLGTVVGLVKCFYTIEQKAINVGAVNPSDLAGGIWEALLTTVGGLCVAIPSYIAYNYFAHKVNSYNLQIERTINEFLEVFFSEGRLKEKEKVNSIRKEGAFTPPFL
ncbi:MAG: hypothetical protein B6D56_00860 [Candidatus Omnitrophica bacterium 4484_70.1]|nr:MAG: hypothetical protein B6D56_00860 [Candidatus Omnitrophica bacterium 4484_70.1]